MPRHTSLVTEASADGSRIKHKLHIYQRSKSNKEIYRCVHPYCKHYDRKEFILDKAAECPKCHNEFILTREHLRNKNPVCLGCSKSPKAKIHTAAAELIDQILENVNNVKMGVPEDSENKLPEIVLEELEKEPELFIDVKGPEEK